MPKQIYFIRHPRPEVPLGVCYGNSDVKPDKASLEEAAQKARFKLNGAQAEVCYSSPLSRCIMLAGRLIEEDRIIISERIREANFGRWEMVAWADIPADEQQVWGEDFINCKIHGGESFRDVQKRMLIFLDEVVQTSYSNILVVTHAGLLRALLAHLLEASPRKIFAIHINYGDVICLEWHNKEYYKVRYL
jgi:alpha-ribazole phosphatase